MQESEENLEIDGDPLYAQAVKIVLSSERASISVIQKNLRIGFARSAKMLDQMERDKIVGPAHATGIRTILPPYSKTPAEPVIALSIAAPASPPIPPAAIHKSLQPSASPSDAKLKSPGKKSQSIGLTILVAIFFVVAFILRMGSK